MLIPAISVRISNSAPSSTRASPPPPRMKRVWLRTWSYNGSAGIEMKVTTMKTPAISATLLDGGFPGRPSGSRSVCSGGGESVITGSRVWEARTAEGRRAKGRPGVGAARTARRVSGEVLKQPYADGARRTGFFFAAVAHEAPRSPGPSEPGHRREPHHPGAGPFTDQASNRW